MLGKSLRYALLASGLALTTAIALAPAAFAIDEVRGTASNQITGNLSPSASISWPQPNSFAIQKPDKAVGVGTGLVQYINLSTNVSYDANVPWKIKAQSLNNGSLVNSVTPAETIPYNFSLGIGSQGTTSTDAPFVGLTNAAGGVDVVSGIPGRGELVPRLELNFPATTTLSAGQFNDTITLFMVTP